MSKYGSNSKKKKIEDKTISVIPFKFIVFTKVSDYF